MTEMLSFVLLGVLLVAIFLFLLWRPRAQNEHAPVGNGSEFEKLPLPAELLIERIFGADDWNFLRDRVPENARNQFLKERREIAFFWLSLIRVRARSAMDFHLTQARSLRSVEPALEFRIAVNYLAFQISCGLVAGLLWLAGPIATRSLFRRADLLCGKLNAMTRVPLKTDSASQLVKG